MFDESEKGCSLNGEKIQDRMNKKNVVPATRRYNAKWTVVWSFNSRIHGC